MKKLTMVLLVLLVAGNSKAQLASEKPMSVVFSDATERKLQQPKPIVAQSRELPSEAVLPRQVVAVQKPMTTKPQRIEPVLPSDAQRPVVRFPKKQS